MMEDSLSDYKVGKSIGMNVHAGAGCATGAIFQKRHSSEAKSLYLRPAGKFIWSPTIASLGCGILHRGGGSWIQSEVFFFKAWMKRSMYRGHFLSC